jgi:hypothetical protein
MEYIYTDTGTLHILLADPIQFGRNRVTLLKKDILPHPDSNIGW